MNGSHRERLLETLRRSLLSDDLENAKRIADSFQEAGGDLGLAGVKSAVARIDGQVASGVDPQGPTPTGQKGRLTRHLLHVGSLPGTRERGHRWATPGDLVPAGGIRLPFRIPINTVSHGGL